MNDDLIRFFVGMDTLEAIKQGKAQYIPISIAHLPRLMENETKRKHR